MTECNPLYFCRIQLKSVLFVYFNLQRVTLHDILKLYEIQKKLTLKRCDSCKADFLWLMGRKFGERVDLNNRS